MIDARFFIALFKGSNINVVPVSLFQGYDQKSLIVYRNKKEIIVKMYCDQCKEYSKFKFTISSLNKPGGYRACCAGCGNELGYVGPREDIEAIAAKHRRDVEALMREMGFDDYFTNPFIMYEMINHVHDMAEDKKIQCQCGSRDVTANIGTDRIELVCKNCGGRHIIKAATQKDLEIAKEKPAIIIKSKLGGRKATGIKGI